MPFERRIVILISNVPQLNIGVIAATGHPIITVGENAKTVNRRRVALQQTDLFALVRIPNMYNAPV